MANTRFTIVNDNKDQILISKSLRDQVTKQQQAKQQQTNVKKPDETIPKPVSEDPISASKSSSENTASTGGNYPSLYPELPSLPSSPLPPQQSQQSPFVGSNSFHSPPQPYQNFNSSGFDPNFLLLELRNEYERKLQQYQMLWRKNVDDLDRLNKDLLKKNKELFTNEVKRIDDAVLKKHFADTSNGGTIREQPCKDVEEKIIRCFEVNGKKSLLCSNLIREFSQCIDKARMNMLKQN